MFIPPATFSLLMTTKSTGVSLLFKIINSGRLLAVALMRSPTVLKQWVFVRFGFFPLFDWSAHRCVHSYLASPRKYIFQPGYSTCARYDPERPGPGHTGSPSIPASIISWYLFNGGLGGWRSPEYYCFTETDVEEDIQTAIKIRHLQRRTKAFQWLILS